MKKEKKVNNQCPINFIALVKLLIHGTPSMLGLGVITRKHSITTQPLNPNPYLSQQHNSLSLSLSLSPTVN